MVLDPSVSGLGFLMLFVFSYVGIKQFANDQRLRTLSFLVGIGTAAILAGLDIPSIASSIGQYISANRNPAGLVTSGVALSLFPLAPTAGLRGVPRSSPVRL